MKRLLQFLGICSSFVLAGSVWANTYMSSLTDLWWNASESGWGVTISHQREVVFLTFFVYGQDGRPQWFTGQATYSRSTSNGEYVFEGQVYAVNGPWFGSGIFSPAAVSARQAGSMTLTSSLNNATLTYSVDGVQVTKSITRQTFRNNDVSGSYYGTMRQAQSFCRAPATNGTFLQTGDVSVINTSNSLQMTVSSPQGSCVYSGFYSQTGNIGQSQGTYICTGGISGAYSAYEIDANISGFTARFVSGDNVCNVINGRIAAVRK